MKQSSYKASFYNVFFPFDDEYILFNTREGTIFVIDSETKALLEKNDVPSLDEEHVREFIDNGIIVEDRLNEQDAYRLVYERSKYVVPLTDVQITTTYECNLACVYCFEGKGQLEHKRMDAKTAKCAIKFVQELFQEDRTTTLRLGLFGGEPLLNMPVSLVLANELSLWCEENNKQFVLNALTNGTLCTKEVVEDLAPYNCNFLVVVDGPRDIHDRRRVYKNGKGTFDDIVDGLHQVSDHGLRIHLRINVDETNKDDVVHLFEFLKEEGLIPTSLNIKSVFNTSPACSSYSYCMPDTEGLAVINRLYSVARSMSLVAGELEGLFPLWACAAHKFSNFVIDPYLRLFKCNILLPFEKNAVGIIKTENSKPIFNHVNVDFMSRDPLEVAECRVCTLMPICRGGCSAEVFETQGTTHGRMCRKEGLYEMVHENVSTFVRRTVQNKQGK